MTDYSKPMGWWCLDCESFVDEGADLDHCDVHEMGHREIPVFAIIPEGERPKTNEPDGDDIVTFKWRASVTDIWYERLNTTKWRWGASSMGFFK